MPSPEKIPAAPLYHDPENLFPQPHRRKPTANARGGPADRKGPTPIQKLSPMPPCRIAPQPSVMAPRKKTSAVCGVRDRDGAVEAVGLCRIHPVEHILLKIKHLGARRQATSRIGKRSKGPRAGVRRIRRVRSVSLTSRWTPQCPPSACSGVLKVERRVHAPAYDGRVGNAPVNRLWLH